MSYAEFYEQDEFEEFLWDEDVEDDTDENWDDSFKNAKGFRILRGRFPDNAQRLKFNQLANQVCDEIVEVAKYLTGGSGDIIDHKLVDGKMATLTKKQQKSVIKKAQEIAPFLKVDSSRHRFTDWVRQVLINLLYVKEIAGWIKYSRDAKLYVKGKRYRKMLKPQQDETGQTLSLNDKKAIYYPFIFIADALYLPDIAENQIGNYHKDEKIGYMSRIRFTEHGATMFEEFLYKTVFEDLSDRDLIRKTDREEYTDGKGEKRKRIIILDYKITDQVYRKINKIKRINEFYKSTNLRLKCKNIFLKNCNHINDIYVNIINFNIKDIFLSLTYNNLITNDRTLDLLYKRIQTMNTRDNINIEKYLYREEEQVSLLMEKQEKYQQDNELKRHFEKHKTDLDHQLLIKEMESTINQKNLFRVFSRGKWNMHGRFYGGTQMNLPKPSRQQIYVDDIDAPLISLDFSGMHPRMAYHLEGLVYDGDPYIIKGYGLTYREIFKIVALIAMNAPTWQSAIWTIVKKVTSGLGVYASLGDAARWLEAFKNEHGAIAKYICSDFGIRAMYQDSLIMEDCLTEPMLKKGIVNLPLHDELLFLPDQIEVVRPQMVESYRKVMRTALLENGKLTKSAPLPKGIKPIIA